MIPATDCPKCPECGLPCGTRTSQFAASFIARQAGPSWLSCDACGHVWEGSAEEVAQAERADAAYEEEMR